MLLKFLRPAPGTRLLMVCLGNICRSPMAQIVTQHLVQQAGLAQALQVDSAGTHAARGSTSPDPRAGKVLVARGYPAGKLRSRQVTEQDFLRFDQILAMDQANLNDLRQICPAEHTHKLRLFMEFATGFTERDVPDPYYGSLQSFEHVLDMVESGARGLITSHTAR